MMDLVLLGLFAFWLGKNIDGFDFDFSQNQEEPRQDKENAAFSEWVLIREQEDAKSQGTITYRLESRNWVDDGGRGEVLWTQYRILKNGEVFRRYSSDSSLEEVEAAFNEMVRPRTEEEQQAFDERLREKEEANASQNQQKTREELYQERREYAKSLNDPDNRRNGVM
tara:strand:+ start:1202 stop:1705 length:504 start_codon:yes stop_codon:yes gene_type:complete